MKPIITLFLSLTVCCASYDFFPNVVLGEPYIFSLEEVQCNLEFFTTRLNLIHNGTVFGKYHDLWYTFNRDLHLHSTKHNSNAQQEVPYLKTDIKSFLQIRKQEKIYVENSLVAIVEQEFVNTFINTILTTQVGSFKPFINYQRRYSIYDRDRQLIGVVVKDESLIQDSVLKILDVEEKTVLAVMTKKLNAKFSSLVCQNAVWDIQILTTDGSIITRPEIVATILAIKARNDILAVSQERWKFISEMAHLLFPPPDKEHHEVKN